MYLVTSQGVFFDEGNRPDNYLFFDFSTQTGDLHQITIRFVVDGQDVLNVTLNQLGSRPLNETRNYLPFPPPQGNGPLLNRLAALVSSLTVTQKSNILDDHLLPLRANTKNDRVKEYFLASYVGSLAVLVIAFRHTDSSGNPFLRILPSQIASGNEGLLLDAFTDEAWRYIGFLSETYLAFLTGLGAQMIRLLIDFHNTFGSFLTSPMVPGSFGNITQADGIPTALRFFQEVVSGTAQVSLRDIQQARRRALEEISQTRDASQLSERLFHDDLLLQLEARVNELEKKIQ